MASIDKVNSQKVSYLLKSQDYTAIQLGRLCKKYSVEVVRDESGAYCWGYPCSFPGDDREVWIVDRVLYGTREAAQLSALSHIFGAARISDTITH